MRNVAVVLVFLFGSVAACLGQSGTNANCTLAGTWYGGSPDAGFPYYHMTLTPLTSSSFSTRGQYDSEIGSLGYLHATDWTGDLTQNGKKTFRGFIMSMWQWDPASNLLPPGVDAALPEMDFIPYNVEFLDCNSFKGTIHHWYVYFNFTNDIKPLSKQSRPPDLVMDFDPPIVEIYHRAPNSCPGCPFANATSNMTSVPAWKPGRGPQKK